jgi:outer membrane immunogenic protein
MRIVLGLVVIAALPQAGVLAADLEIRRPAPAPYVSAPPPPSWTGFYVGVGVSARFNAVDGNVTSATYGDPPKAIPLPEVSPGYDSLWKWWGAGPGAHQYIDNISIGARFYGGWNWQVAPAWVIGVEADFAYANEIAVYHGSPYPVNLIFGEKPFGASHYDEFKVKTGWDGSARLRAGWLANPSLLIYLTAGLAWAHLEVISSCSTRPEPSVNNCAPGNYFDGGTLGPAVITHSGTKLGWTAGSGVDMLLGSGWVARVQYRFADFGYPSVLGMTPFSFSSTRTCTGPGCSGANSPLTVTYELPLMQHNFEAGIAYKF